MGKNKKIDELGIVNPKDMSLEELDQLITETNQKLSELYKEQKKLEKQLRGKLWLWWLLPIFGWIVYSSLLAKRKSDPKKMEKLLLLKREISKKEIQKIFNQKRLDQLAGHQIPTPQ